MPSYLLLADQGQLERAGNAHQGDVRRVQAVAFQVVQSAAHQAVHDKVVEAGCHDGDLQALGVEPARDGFDLVHVNSCAVQDDGKNTFAYYL